MNFNQMLDINPETGEIISKVFRRGAGPAGHRIGSLNTHGYLWFLHNGKRFLNHRVIWESLHGEIPPGMQIDHVNGNRADNRIANLRLVDSSTNAKNRKTQFNNSTGVNGVYPYKDTGRYCAQIGSKTSGTRKFLGIFDTLFDAACARKSAEIELNYHPNHGRRS
ncbi:HNH endonuclease signature motif containing protein [Citrobacter braakii]|uniref:HNH endonuclease signature motif containing protein n=1 Tax=Citrobacter braakii TaxID=57706 RepID=UPI00397E05B7